MTLLFTLWRERERERNIIIRHHFEAFASTVQSAWVGTVPPLPNLWTLCCKFVSVSLSQCRWSGQATKRPWSDPRVLAHSWLQGANRGRKERWAGAASATPQHHHRGCGEESGWVHRALVMNPDSAVSVCTVWVCVCERRLLINCWPTGQSTVTSWNLIMMELDRSCERCGFYHVCYSACTLPRNVPEVRSPW